MSVTPWTQLDHLACPLCGEQEAAGRARGPALLGDRRAGAARGAGTVKAFMVTWSGIVAFVAAKDAPQAKILCARSIHDAFGTSVGRAFIGMRCRRHPRLDPRAAGLTAPAFLIESEPTP
jgi:hypothetical protein